MYTRSTKGVAVPESVGAQLALFAMASRTTAEMDLVEEDLFGDAKLPPPPPAPEDLFGDAPPPAPSRGADAPEEPRESHLANAFWSDWNANAYWNIMGKVNSLLTL